MRKVTYILALLVVFALNVTAQRQDSFTKVKEFSIDDGLTQNRFQELVEDSHGYIWISSWNGLIRYDGYTFETFYISSSHHSSNKIWRIRLSENGMIYCQTSNGVIYEFNPRKCRFTGRKSLTMIGWPNGKVFSRMKSIDIPKEISSAIPEVRSCYMDRKGEVWFITPHSLGKTYTSKKILTDLDDAMGANIRAMMVDKNGRLWVGSKDSTLRVAGKYVKPDGSYSDSKVKFANAAIYCMYSDPKGRILIGTKGDGLFVLTPSSSYHGEKSQGRNPLHIKHFVHNKANEKSISLNEIYCIVENGEEYYIGTWGGGITRFDGKFFRGIEGYPSGNALKVRAMIRLGNGTIVAGTSDGLIMLKGNKLWHSMKGRDVMSLEEKGSSLYAAVYGLGICELSTNKLPTRDEEIKEYRITRHKQASLICTSILLDDNIWIFSEDCLAKFSLRTHQYSIYDEHHFGSLRYFSEAKPIIYRNKVVAGTERGLVAFGNSHETINKQPIFISAIQYMTEEFCHPLGDVDTIMIHPNQRSFTLFLTTLDFCNAKSTDYSYLLEGFDGHWNYSINNTVGFSNLPPGNYRLHLRASNGNGVYGMWERVVNIRVLPTFTETTAFHLLISLLVIGIIIGSVYTFIYIRRLHRKQKELEEYVRSLVSSTRHDGQANVLDVVSSIPQMSASDKEFLDRFANLFKENMSNEDIRIEDYAKEMGMSHSVFYRRMKSLVGTSPVDFIRKLRIQYAVKLFDEGETRVAEVSYRAGFNNPRYFSKCFHDEVNLTPSEYIQNLKSKI